MRYVDDHMEHATAPLTLLRSRFGYESFRPLQSEIIDNVLAQRDSLVLMPTGGGKSLCYQLPALVLEGTALVVSPLIALMKDQVDALNATGVIAACVNSSLSDREVQQVQARVRQGKVKLLYVAPERLALPGFQRFLRELRLSLIAIDEAHCISEWGHEFRPDYRNLRQLRQDFPSVPVIALTATATQRVRQDIIDQLALQQGRVFLSSFDRENLRYSVLPKQRSWEQLTTLLDRYGGQPTIIYCLSRKETEEIAAGLREKGYAARAYHAGLDSETRRLTQEEFVRDRVPIVVATIAFGMGIDKPDVRLVVHHSLPKSLEGYYQETGRAGRDGLPSECVLFYAYADKVRQDYFINRMDNDTEQKNARDKIARMVKYAELSSCRRQFLLEYFGESWAGDNCGGCDACLDPREQFDASEVAQKILSAVVRTGERFGVAYVIRVLLGSRDKRILEMGHHELSVYGIERNWDRSELREIAGQLQDKGLLAQGGGEYPTLLVTPEGREFLRRRDPLLLSRPVGNRRTETRRSAPSVDDNYDRSLFEELRTLRRRLAEERGLPPYIVFGDTSLRHMAKMYPRTIEEFADVHGVGAARLQEYGRQFVEVIEAYAAVHGLPDHATHVNGRMPGTTKRSGGTQDRQHGLSLTFEATRDLLEQGLSVAEIASERGLAETTVIGHLERIADLGETLHLAHALPETENLNEIEGAFNVCGSVLLKPVWEFLGSRYTFDELRLARLYLRQEGRVPQG